MGRWLDRLRRPGADSTSNKWTAHVIGNKADAAAAGAVTETDSLIAYTKQLITSSIAIDGQTNKTSTKKSVASVTTANIFTVAGGAVRVLGITGHITTGLEASANNTKLVHTSTGGAAVDLCAVLDVTGSAIRKLLTITGTAANAMSLSSAEGVIVGNLATPLVLTPGVVSLNCAATTTGAIDWYITYEPMASGANITAV